MQHTLDHPITCLMLLFMTFLSSISPHSNHLKQKISRMRRGESEFKLQMDGKWILMPSPNPQLLRAKLNLLIRAIERSLVPSNRSSWEFFCTMLCSLRSPRKTNNSLLSIVPFCFLSFVYRPFGNTSAQLSIDNVFQCSAHCENLLRRIDS